MANAQQAFEAIIIPYEGLYSNDKNDRGGETVWGIARNIDKDAPIWKLVDDWKKKPDFPRNMMNDKALIIAAADYYKKRYWDNLNLSSVNNQTIATELFDISVNMGPGVAGTFLQRALNVLNRNGQDYPDLLVDGQVGPKTVSALNSHKSPENVLLCLNALQGAKYIGICENNPSQEVFMNGWIKRIKVA